VRSIYEELVARKVDLTSPIALLSDQTSWQMSVLLEDCLLFPKILPYVREKDEVRRYLRCHLCRQRERPIDAKLFWFCDVCMQRALDAVQARKPAKGLIFFAPTTQNADADILTQTLFWLQTKRMVGLTALASSASSTRSAGANERLNRSLYVTSLRAKRSNPAFHVLLWIASSLRSSQ
jgi:hypothetical protein